MPTVELKLPHHQYEIHIDIDLLQRLGQLVNVRAAHARAALLADELVYRHYGEPARSALLDVGYDVLVTRIPTGEANKNLDTVRNLYNALIEARLERKSPLIALGGGVTGDTAGFVAATYLRGIPFIQCPTTLLAMVDASVGGKVGVNLPQGKNLVGAFHQPVLVVIDPATLKTLPTRELRCGLAECVKHAVIRDASLFDWLETNIDAILNLDMSTLVQLVKRNVQIKAKVVMADEKETGERAHLNLGHTFAHAIETRQAYGRPTADTQTTHTYHHGEAVALGMVAASRLAANLGRCDRDIPRRIEGLLDRIGLPTRSSCLPPTGELLETMRLDKKVLCDHIRLVLPVAMGEVTMTIDVPPAAISDAWDSLRQTATS